ncbi:MAG TPA: alpha/beta hydrolase [Hyphomicrobiaceae bacterium]|jgi:acetyl esterase|nr:alpha/beta hydrolase [Hyphomicrobiaceae bacterium]
MATASGLDPDLARILPLLPLRDAASLTPARARQDLVALADSRKDVPLPQPAAVADTEIPTAAGALAARIYRPSRMPTGTLMYFHGGGWVAGDLYTHDRLARTLAIELEAVVLSVDYRRPPEAPFPCAFEDCFAATQWAHRHIDKLGGDAKRLGVGGDSAGGNLAAAVALAWRNEAQGLAAQLLIYPVTDVVGCYGESSDNARYPSRGENAEGYFLTLEAMRFFARAYLAEPHDAADPRVSPLRAAELHGLAPAVVCTAEFDPLRDEGEAYAKRLASAGIPVSYFREPGMIHGYFGMGGASPAADAARRRATDKFKQLLVGTA